MKTKVSCTTVYCKFFDLDKSECTFKNVVIMGGECLQFAEVGDENDSPSD